MSGRFPARPGRTKHRVPGSQSIFAYCSSQRTGKPWKYRWAGAATPTQQNTTRPQEPPRRASDVFYGSNLYRKDNPCWGISNAMETPKVPAGAFRVLPAGADPWDRLVAEARLLDPE